MNVQVLVLNMEDVRCSESETHNKEKTMCLDKNSSCEVV